MAEKIKDSKKVRVYKNIVGNITYKLGSNIDEIWNDNVEYKDLTLEKIKEMFSFGMFPAFEKNLLLIKDENIRDYLELPILIDDVLDKTLIKELIESKNYDKIEEVMVTCEENELDMIVDEVINGETTDRNIVGLVEDYTELTDLQDVIEEKKATNKPVTTENNKTIKREKKK